MTKPILIALILTILGTGSMVSSTKNTYMQVYEQFTALSGDETNVAAVKNFVLTRDVATFTLHEGTMYLCSPVNKRVCAAIFTGKGTFSYSPPTDVERKQLSRYYDNERLNEEFKTLVIFFADTTLQELRSRLTFRNGSVSREVNSHLKYALNYLSDDGKDNYFDPSFMTTFLEDQHNGLFYAHFSRNKIEPMVFKIDPLASEEIQFGRRNLAWPGYDWEIINQFHTQADYASGADQDDNPRNKVRISHYAIDASIERDMDFSASAKLVLKSMQRNQQWIDFTLHPRMKVDSVIWMPHTPAPFVDGDEHFQLWVGRDSALKLGQVCSLMVYYHSDDFLEQDDNARLYLRSSVLWYPRHGHRNRATYDLVFQYPSRYTLVSIGSQVSSVDKDEYKISHWRTTGPAKNASFNFGLFKEYMVSDSVRSLVSTGNITLPPIAVYMSEGMRRYSGPSGGATTHAISRDDMVRRVANDIAYSTGFFQTLFNGRPFERLQVSEIPDLHGEAFPGMINLSWVTFEYASTIGSEEIFRAHEVAHQWWGVGVGYKSYHDQWLSEGISQYCGIWYMQAALRNNEKFFAEMNKWKEEIIGNRDFALGKGREAGPIWLGVRTLSNRTSGDYDLIIYKKGAWVLHMLRNMLLDLNTLSEDRFKAMMAEFYSMFKGHDASTIDFQRVAEKHVGQDLSWFFKQWVNETTIPSYQFAHKTVKVSDTSYTVRCRIQQRKVPPEFKMYIPLLVQFADGSFVRFRVSVTGEKMDFDIPDLPMAPVDVEFNYLNSVLCEVETGEWK